jgi:hypothetical protein
MKIFLIALLLAGATLAQEFQKYPPIPTDKGSRTPAVMVYFDNSDSSYNYLTPVSKTIFIDTLYYDTVSYNFEAKTLLQELSFYNANDSADTIIVEMNSPVKNGWTTNAFSLKNHKDEALVPDNAALIIPATTEYRYTVSGYANGEFRARAKSPTTANPQKLMVIGFIGIK